MKKLQFGLRLVLASLLALLLVGFSSVPLLASPVSVPSGPFCESCILTNITFVDQESYDQYRSNCIERVDLALVRCDSMSGALSSARGNLTSSILYQSLAKRNALDASALCDEPSESDIQQEINYSIAQLTISMDYADEALNGISRAQDTNALVRSELQSVRTALDSGATEYNGTFATSCESSAGGCSCPDYTPFLENIEDYLSSLVTYVSTINDWLDENGNWLIDMVWNFFSEADRGTGRNPDEHYEGQAIGNLFGKVYSNLWQSVYYLDFYSRYHGLGTDYLVTVGPPFMQDMWNFILEPYAQLLYANTDSPNTQNRMVNSIRDYYLRDWTYIFPTNTYQRPLWVNMMTNGLGGSTAHPIYVEVTTGSKPVSVDNPVWVNFTNAVHIASSDVVNVALTNGAFEVDFDELIDAMYSLTTAVWSVYVLNTNELAGAIFDEEEKRIKDMQDDLDEEAEPDEETQPLPDTSFSFASSLSSSYREVLTSYKNMFDAIPSAPPDDITIWQGGNYGDLEIQSLHWKFSDHRTLLTHIRNVFAFGWYMVYVFVVFVTAAIDLCVCGVIVYMVYGLFLGKPDVAYHGMLWCFKTLATFFGYKPQSVK